MAVDISKMRAGDEVLAQLAYVRPEGCGWAYYHNSAGQELRIHEASIVSHTPRELQVGDKCRWDQMHGVFEVVSTPRADRRGELEVAVWISDGGIYPAALSDLERIP